MTRSMLVLPMLFALTGCPWDDKKPPAESPPQQSKPYNILDYTKPAAKP